MADLQAKEGLRLIKEAIGDLLSRHPEGLTNAEIAKQLGLESDYEGHHKGYLSWAVLGLMLNAGTVAKRGRRYTLQAARLASAQVHLTGEPQPVAR